MTAATTRLESAVQSRSALPPLVPASHSARIIDALLTGLIVVRVSVFDFSVPVAQLGIIVLLMICLFRRPVRAFGEAWWIPALLTALLGFLVLETWVNGIDPARRAGNLAVLILMAMFLASGRIDVGSAIKGLGLGVIVNAVLFYAGIGPDDYQGRLTGFMQDKNAGALIMAVTMFLLLIVYRSLAMRVAIIALGSAAIFATDSRTTMAATLVAVVWLLISRYLNRGLQLVTLGGAFLLFLWADDNLATFGRYAITREGSDAFRSTIDAASALKTTAAPWYGEGLGEATVSLDSGTWFFHNSYEGLIVEGGFVFLIVFVGLYAIAGLGLAPHIRIDVTSLDARAITAATLVVFCCALRLGEVFLAPIGFVVLGIGIARLLPTVEQRVPVWLS